MQKYLQYNPEDSVWSVKQAVLSGLEVVRLLYRFVYKCLIFRKNTYKFCFFSFWSFYTIHLSHVTIRALFSFQPFKFKLNSVKQIEQKEW